MSPDALESVRCSEPDCSCFCFKPGRVRLRSCDQCGHSWVTHALEKLQAGPSADRGPVEVALPGSVFDLSSLVLYGAQAVPVQLKILLDRLYSVLTPEQVGQILHSLDWSLGDYIRGYMLQDSSGKVLNRWFMVAPEEELLILRQFLRFGETRPIVELMTLRSLEGEGLVSDPTSQRNVRRNRGAQPAERLPGPPSRLLPLHVPLSDIQSFLPSTKDVVLNDPTQIQKIPERREREAERTGSDRNPVQKQSRCGPASSIKTESSDPSRSLWPRHTDQELLLQPGVSRQEKPSPLSRPSNPSMTPSSPSFLHPSISTSFSSRLQNSQRFPGSPSSLPPLPSFSSSFLCPLHTTSFSPSLHPLPSSSSSLQPLPSSLCSFSSLSSAGGRKGRVCCGVCGKSFYDKGTLKIHYNAVHLKIKHRCTVLGCSMVFSSLRSRNRHSANPNPRLHTGAVRDVQPFRNTHCEHANQHANTQVRVARQDHRHEEQMFRERESRNTLWQSQNTHTLKDMETGGDLHHGCHSNRPHQDGSPAPHCDVDHQTLSLDRPQNQIHPLLLRGQAPPPGVAPCCSIQLTNQQWRLVHPSPKKKSRKSSMPVKIERETVQRRRHEEREEEEEEEL